MLLMDLSLEFRFGLASKLSLLVASELEGKDPEA